VATRLDLNYDAQVADVRTKVGSYAMRLWNGSPAYRDADAERIVALLIPRVEAGQARIAQLTDAYIARLVADELSGGIVRGAVADVSTEALRGVAAEEVYRRPFVTAYAELAQGATLTSAIGTGGARLSSLVDTGMQLARTHSARQAGERTKVKQWRRVLTGRENCALCSIVSTQTYYRGDLMPIHGHCDCIPKPLFGSSSELRDDTALSRQMREAVDAEFGGTARGEPFEGGKGTPSDYLGLIAVNEHGEIGPTLGWSWQNFTSKADIGL
jgi:hypothetical protein